MEWYIVNSNGKPVDLSFANEYQKISIKKNECTIFDTEQDAINKIAYLATFPQNKNKVKGLRASQSAIGWTT